jgi:hypothetical protein
MAVLIEDSREQLLFAGDAILHPLQVGYPALRTAFDVQPEQSALTRLRLLDRCATEGAMTFHFHFPFPCLGTIARWSGGSSGNRRRCEKAGDPQQGVEQHPNAA